VISFSKEKCTSCGTCVKVCPQAVITIKARTAHLTDYQSCMECGACELNCKYGAIKVTKGTGCLIAIIKEDILKIGLRDTSSGCDSG